MSWLVGGLLGQRNPKPQTTVPPEVLLTKLQDPNQIDDRRRIISDIKSLSKDPSLFSPIGKGIPALVSVLKSDRSDLEIVRDIVEIFINVTTKPKDEKETAFIVNTELIVREANNVDCLLSLLEERDYYVRYHITQLLTQLLSNRGSLFQDAILKSPMGVVRLMDLLNDTREIVRNAALLLILELAKGNQEVQKIVAFEGAFEKLLEIIHRDEGGSEGGIIAQDCLQLINTLLYQNVSNQNYFRESNCIRLIPPLLQVQNSDMWLLTDNKFAILSLTLELVSLLVSSSTNTSTYTNQSVLAQSNVMNLVIRLALGKMGSMPIRGKALFTLGDLMRGHSENQAIFANANLLNETSKQTQPCLHRLTLVGLQAKDLIERLSALYTFQCYLFDNSEGQIALASTVTPPPENADGTPPSEIDNSLSIGGLLLRALLGWETASPFPQNGPTNPNSNILTESSVLSSWISGCMFSCILNDNQVVKDLLLRIPLEIPKPGAPLVTLLTKVVWSLSQAVRVNSDVVIKIALLRLLCVWMSQSPSTVKAFLQTPSNLPFLVDLVIQPMASIHVSGLSALLIGLCFQFNEDDLSSEFSRSSLQGIITSRIGVDKFMDKLDQLRKTTEFTQAEQSTIHEFDPTKNDPSTTTIKYYDYDFTIFYKDAYDKVQRQIRQPIKQKQPTRNNANTSTPIRPSTPSTTTTTTENANNTHNPSTNTTTTPSPQQDHHHDAVVNSYKELIRNQDREVTFLKAKNQEYEQTIKGLENKVTSLSVVQPLVPPHSPRVSSSPSPTFPNINNNSPNLSIHLPPSHNVSESIIKQKDEEIQALQEEVKTLTERLSTVVVSELFGDTSNNGTFGIGGDIGVVGSSRGKSVNEFEAELQSLSLAYNDLEGILKSKDEEIVTLTQKLRDTAPSPRPLHTTPKLRFDQNEVTEGSSTPPQVDNSALLRLQEKEKEIQKLKEEITRLNNEAQHSSQQQGMASQQLIYFQDQAHQAQRQILSLQQSVQQSKDMITSLQTQLAAAQTASITQASKMPDNRDLRIQKLELQLREQVAKYNSLEKEQEEVLQTLSNLELENNNLKERLIQLGETF